MYNQDNKLKLHSDSILKFQWCSEKNEEQVIFAENFGLLAVAH